MLRRSSIIVLILGLAAVPARAADKLEWKFTQGEKFYQEIVTVARQIERTGGQENKRDINNTLVAAFTVQKKDPDGSVVLEQKIESIKINTPRGPDTTEDVFQRVQGAAFKITLNSKMQITKFEGYEDLVKRISNDDPVVAKIIRTQMPEDDLRKDVEQLFAFLPDKAVSDGEKWQREFPVPLGSFGSLAADYVYTFKGKDTTDSNLQKIEYTAKATYVPPKPKEGALPFKVVKSDVKADEIKGTITFDPGTGKMVKYEMKMKVKGTMTVLFMGQTFDQELETDQTVTTRILDKNPLKK